MVDVLKKRFDMLDMVVCAVSACVVNDYGLFSYEFFVFALVLFFAVLIGCSFFKVNKND